MTLRERFQEFLTVRLSHVFPPSATWQRRSHPQFYRACVLPERTFAGGVGGRGGGRAGKPWKGVVRVRDAAQPRLYAKPDLVADGQIAIRVMGRIWKLLWLNMDVNSFYRFTRFEKIQRWNESIKREIYVVFELVWALLDDSEAVRSRHCEGGGTSLERTEE